MKCKFFADSFCDRLYDVMIGVTNSSPLSNLNAGALLSLDQCAYLSGAQVNITPDYKTFR